MKRSGRLQSVARGRRRRRGGGGGKGVPIAMDDATTASERTPLTARVDVEGGGRFGRFQDDARLTPSPTTWRRRDGARTMAWTVCVACVATVAVFACVGSIGGPRTTGARARRARRCGGRFGRFQNDARRRLARRGSRVEKTGDVDSDER